MQLAIFSMFSQPEKNTLTAHLLKHMPTAARIFCYVLLIIFNSATYAESDHHDHHDHHEQHNDHHDHKHHDEHDHDAEFTQHAAHQHGHATCSISYSENEIIVSLTLPSIDVFGFEHKATNQQEQAVVEQALNQLSVTDNIIKLEPTCDPTTHQVDYAPSDSSNDNNMHSDVNMNIHFACSNDISRHITFELFNVTPSLEHIEIGYISDNKQALFSVTQDNNSITLD